MNMLQRNEEWITCKQLVLKPKSCLFRILCHMMYYNCLIVYFTYVLTLRCRWACRKVWCAWERSSAPFDPGGLLGPRGSSLPPAFVQSTFFLQHSCSSTYVINCWLARQTDQRRHWTTLIYDIDRLWLERWRVVWYPLLHYYKFINFLNRLSLSGLPGVSHDSTATHWNKIKQIKHVLCHVTSNDCTKYLAVSVWITNYE